jgi:hypothetical protein
LINQAHRFIGGCLELGAAEKAPAIGGLGFDNSKKAGETMDRRYLVETEIHLETCTKRKEKGANRGMARQGFSLSRYADTAQDH